MNITKLFAHTNSNSNSNTQPITDVLDNSNSNECEKNTIFLESIHK